MNGKFKEAGKHCQELMTMDYCQSSDSLKYSYIECLIYDHDLTQAQKELDILLKNDSQVPELNYLNGLCSQYSGDR